MTADPLVLYLQLLYDGHLFDRTGFHDSHADFAE